MGISWNVKGVDVGTAAKPISKAAVPEKPDSSLRPAPGDLFSSINKGAGITTGLKKVDDTMKTHKNPQLRASAVVPDTEKTKPQIATKPTIIASKPALMELRDKKWIVENQTDQKMLEISECDKSYTVYMYNCVKTNLIVHGKMNTVAIVYLNEKSKEARVSTSLASSVNVCLCQPNADLIEYPVPEQLISYIEGEKLITKMSENI
ncbi:hypothetical protein MXB_5265 [Myxobolus squamalis]|nr:hypothetical protein MXB_5265 [Myxobolus squamalis]